MEIGDSVTSIGDRAFGGCTSLTSVVIGDSVTSIGYEAFEGCTSLTSVYITDIAAWCNIDFGKGSANPLYYAKNLYLNNELVTELVIPDTVTEIKAYAFRNCTSLTSVTINGGSIGSDTFYKCTSLTSVVIGDSVTSIGDWAFEYCRSLTSVTINGGSIGSYAFYGCTSLTSVVIGDSVTSIGDYAFYYCTSLTSVYYKGTAEDWAKISVSSYNTYLTNATRYYYSETEPTDEGNYWHYDENGEIVVW